MGLIKFITAGGFLTIFCISILAFSIGFANDNNSEVNLGGDSDYINLQNQLGGVDDSLLEDSNSSYNAFSTSTLETGSDSTKTGGQFKVGIGTIIGTFKNTLTTSYKKIFGEDGTFAVVFTIIISLLIFFAGLWGYKAWKGDPE